jgi:hypothetical protein
MLAVPASIACSDTLDVEGARRHLAVAEQSASRWEGRAWDAAVLEARAHLARAEGKAEDFKEILAEAARLFTASGHPIDAERVARAAHGLAAAPVPV